ncbi:transcription/translation regulatory transformer protein RfaH [Veronia nyctiphanis]|uniref:transcription/translation regulatory transformer protein RfaH n=1 Tax=Veronia nyctiphanis TaxID=1278244 RepID=UPI002E2538E1
MRRGKRSTLLEPLFPNYVFVNFDPEVVSFTTVRSTRGVLQFVRSGSEPSIVSIEIIKSLMVCEDSDSVREHFREGFCQGDNVIIHNGPYQGVSAVFKEPDGDKRSILLLSLLNNSVLLSVDNNDISFSSSQ